MMSSGALFDLTGKRALVTGSAEGIGFAIAKQFVAHGCDVVVHDKVDVAKCKQACTELQGLAGGEVTFAVANFENPYSVEGLADTVSGIDMLILNASMQLRQDVLSISRDEFDRHVNTNFWSTLRLVQYFLPAMVEKRWGRIVTIGSVQETKPHPQMAVYAALKAAVSNLVINLASQFGKDGVTVNNIAPGVVETARNQEALADAQYADQVRQKIPLGYFGQPDDYSGIALLLCSEAGRYITGQTIYCDGGLAVR